MILKSVSRKSGVSQLINYVLQKDKNLPKSKRPTILIRHNLRAKDAAGFIKEFKHNESFRLRKRSNSVEAYHLIMSFDPRDTDQLNPKILKDLVKHYIALRGKENQYLFVRHQDKDHAHIHGVMGGLSHLTGRSNRISKKSFEGLKIALDGYQREKYPSLANSLPAHGKAKAKTNEKQNQLRIRTGRLSQKQSLLNLLESSYASSKSLKDFISQITNEGHSVYYRNGKLTGVKFEDNLKFRFSRLEYDQEKLAKLDRSPTKEEKALSELRQIRDRNQTSREEPARLNAQRMGRKIDRPDRDPER